MVERQARTAGNPFALASCRKRFDGRCAADGLDPAWALKVCTAAQGIGRRGRVMFGTVSTLQRDGQWRVESHSTMIGGNRIDTQALPLWLRESIGDRDRILKNFIGC
jgi:hypothetical protein